MLKRFIDAHVHLNAYSPALMKFAEEQGAQFLSINTDVPIFPSLDEQARVIATYQSGHPEKVRHTTSFDMQDWQKKDWSMRAIDRIKKGIDQGATGIKIWKNIGMDPTLVYSDGRFLMIDDPKLAPVLEFIQENDLLLIAHLGEPRNCWLPLEAMTVDSDREYFEEHPHYHMYRHPQYPSYETQIRVRDQILERYPNLRFVGLHLFSLEWNLREVEQRLNRYPHTMTDLAERICHVQLQSIQDREAVRDFFIRQQDRVIYGTDFIYDGSQSPREAGRHLRDLWERHWRFFATEDRLQAPQFSGTFRGLGLPLHVLKKIFYENAVKTYGFSQAVQHATVENFS
ncbi:amidohydrolase family protein [Flavilitoribacter nigricans]|uniref:Hydrolase n=1 Tax=Flavilitoribacter nigricans (strain ATCC 23147 / DSM 23189 / NBRC 102662 / NCIMB 1420 / SS-2) TaxID=1122177 RepID=A0A2D0N0T8_FLAN2|nr:amidohydrolase family protein [Flavilitoribacter nigricans]PHN02050.1 hydrolase [Flavilitoribacter nigricans DSM 23189 = NBRC 102662]